MLLALILVPIATAILFGAGGFYAGLTYRRKTAEAAIGSAEQEAKRIMEDAIKAAEAKKKEAVLEGNDVMHRLRNESE